MVVNSEFRTWRVSPLDSEQQIIKQIQSKYLQIGNSLNLVRFSIWKLPAAFTIWWFWHEIVVQIWLGFSYIEDWFLSNLFHQKPRKQLYQLD